MSEVLILQEEETETPEEDKGSWVSIAACRNSHRSIALCYVK